MSERLALRMRADYFENIINKDIGFFDERRTGDLLSRLNTDIDVIQQALSSNASMLIRAVIVIIGCLVLMFYLSPALTGVFIALMLPLGFFTIYYGEKMRKLQKELSDQKAEMSNITEEAVGNIRTVKSFSNEEQECQKFLIGNIKVKELGYRRVIWTAAFGFFQQLILYGSMTIIMKVATVFYNNGKIEIGTVTSFFFYMLQMTWQFTMI